MSKHNLAEKIQKYLHETVLSPIQYAPLEPAIEKKVDRRCFYLDFEYGEDVVYNIQRPNACRFILPKRLLKDAEGVFKNFDRAVINIQHYIDEHKGQWQEKILSKTHVRTAYNYNNEDKPFTEILIDSTVLG